MIRRPLTPRQCHTRDGRSLLLRLNEGTTRMPEAPIQTPLTAEPVDRLTLGEEPARGAAPAIRGCEPCMAPCVGLPFAEE